MPKRQRIRDPIHDLVEFGVDDFEQMVWSLLETPEFQRLRRIRQLGFSELVFPGATHSRFAHSVGVFHTARQLARHIKEKYAGADDARAQVAMAAALVHDVGHGPFSHAFETAAKKLMPKATHEEWTIEIVNGDTRISEIFERFRPGFGREVAQLIADDFPHDVYGSIVSSQFDADRLDYVRRDPVMCGVHHGGFDCSWIFANLEVDEIALARDDETFGTAPGLVLGRKAFQSAEAYVLGLFHLYFTVYFHKATRSAEKMLSALILRILELVSEGRPEDSALAADHPIMAFISKPALAQYLSLDDFIFWSAFRQMMGAKDNGVKELATRLLERKLYKAIDVSSILEHRGGEAAVAKFKARLQAAKKAGTFGPLDVFEDTAKRNPYQRRGFETPEALSKVLIRRADGRGIEDLRDCSNVVKALEEKSVFRVYVRDETIEEKTIKLLEGM